MLFELAARVVLGCSTDVDCSLNGVCRPTGCVCDAPWGGEACEALHYARTPPSGHDLFPIERSHNTWNGPIVTGGDGRFHLYAPRYGNFTGIRSLFQPAHAHHSQRAKRHGARMQR